MIAPKEQDEALVLAQREQGEADRVFTVLTRRRGKLYLLAKGERRILSKLRKGIDLFYLTKITFVESPARIILTDVDLINSFPALRENWRKFHLAKKISQLVNDILPLGVAEEKVFFLTKDSFVDLSQASQYFQRYYYYYLWQLLVALGYCPPTLDKSLEEKLSSGFSKGPINLKANFSRKDFSLTATSQFLLKIILEGKKEIFYNLKIPVAEQKNLAWASYLYLNSLALTKDSYSLNFRL